MIRIVLFIIINLLLFGCGNAANQQAQDNSAHAGKSIGSKQTPAKPASQNQTHTDTTIKPTETKSIAPTTAPDSTAQKSNSTEIKQDVPPAVPVQEYTSREEALKGLNDKDANNRWRAVMYLKNLPETGTSDLLDMLNNTNEDVRAAATKALGERTADLDKVVPRLRELLSDPNAGIRATAALTLGDIGTPAGAAIQDLTRLANDPDKTVQEAAANALKKIQGNQ